MSSQSRFDEQRWQLPRGPGGRAGYGPSDVGLSSHQQELVNLLLTGKAVSNVFNDVVELDSGNGNITLLKGISSRSDIGFLSLFEHYNVCQVPSERSGPRRPRSPAPGDPQEAGRRRADSRSRERGPVSITGFGRSAAPLPSKVHTHSQQTPGKGLQGICSVKWPQLLCVSMLARASSPVIRT